MLAKKGVVREPGHARSASNEPAELSLLMTDADKADKAARSRCKEKSWAHPMQPVKAREAAMISEMEIEKLRNYRNNILDPDQRVPVLKISKRADGAHVGQERAVRRMSGLIKYFCRWR